ncbi:DUF5667 domain-containing protein [Chloroflexota bacterium]
MKRSFEDILDACLERITKRGDTIERCLESYPEWADDLEPLLRAAASVKDAASLEASPGFKKSAKSRLMSAVAEKRGEETGRGMFRRWGMQRHWVVAISLVIAILIMGGGTVGASTNSLPGDLLYPVKTTSEKVQTFFTFGNEARANLYAKLAERRIDEIRALAARERNIPTSVLNVMNSDTNRALDIVSENGSFKRKTVVRVVTLTSNQKEMLTEILNNASPAVRERLSNALIESIKAHDRAVGIEQRMPRPQNLKRTPSPGAQTTEEMESSSPTGEIKGKSPEYTIEPSHEETRSPLPAEEGKMPKPGV